MSTCRTCHKGVTTENATLHTYEGPGSSIGVAGIVLALFAVMALLGYLLGDDTFWIPLGVGLVATPFAFLFSHEMDKSLDGKWTCHECEAEERSKRLELSSSDYR